LYFFYKIEIFKKKHLASMKISKTNINEINLGVAYALGFYK
jgi:hypothetical protein